MTRTRATALALQEPGHHTWGQAVNHISLWLAKRIPRAHALPQAGTQAALGSFWEEEAAPTAVGRHQLRSSAGFGDSVLLLPPGYGDSSSWTSPELRGPYARPGPPLHSRSCHGPDWAPLGPAHRSAGASETCAQTRGPGGRLGRHPAGRTPVRQGPVCPQVTVLAMRATWSLLGSGTQASPSLLQAGHPAPGARTFNPGFSAQGARVQTPHTVTHSGHHSAQAAGTVMREPGEGAGGPDSCCRLWAVHTFFLLLSGWTFQSFQTSNQAKTYSILANSEHGGK